MTTRRQVVTGLGALLALRPALAGAATAGPAVPFSWDWLQGEALRRSREPWRDPGAGSPLAEKLSYTELGRIDYRDDRTLWRQYGDASGVKFFPLSRYARRPVTIHVVENGTARPFPYSLALFDMPRGHPLGALGRDAGFSGFRVMNRGNVGDWLAFQGASYFRSAGPLDQYGLSARGIAIDCGLSRPEEFPDFTQFWLERGGDGAVIVHALLEGPSVTGAYRFVNRRGREEVTQDVSAVIHLRSGVERLGIAPLTSMFWYDEGNRAAKPDWRPEVHDSDGLLLHTGAGEHIWRPLANPPHPQVNSFADKAPRGFGLMQRDRDFAHYQDDAVFFEKRPSLWIEPKGDWGAGAVTLYEIPTRREYDDNIVAFWTPARAAVAGAAFTHDYRMRWIGGEPDPSPVARAVNCWTGQGYVPGEDPRPNAGKIVVDFAGDRLAGLDHKSPVRPIIDVTHGTLLNSGCYPVNGQKNVWRLVADLERTGAEPVDARAFLQLGGDALTETFLYQMY